MTFTFTPPKTYPPVRRCIYCPATVYSSARPDFGREHIIAARLGGRWVLREAACEACETAINAFERSLQQHYLQAVRSHLRIGTPREHLPLYDVVTADGTRYRRVEIPEDLYPSSMWMPFLERPGLLVGREGDASPSNIRGLTLQLLRPARQLAINGSAVVSYATTALDTFGFSRMLAKIAHAYAIAEFGQGCLRPLLADYVRAGEGMKPSLVGGSTVIEAPSELLHELGHATERVEGADYLVVRVRLFAQLAAPTYFVVAGEV
jgi:hypothetical protein